MQKAIEIVEQFDEEDSTHYQHKVPNGDLEQGNENDSLRQCSNLIKASLSDYPKLPGNIWENLKARFIAVVRSHSLY